MAKGGSKRGIKFLTRDMITALRAEIMQKLDGNGMFPRGVAEELQEKYGIGKSSLGWHKRKAQKGIGAGESAPVNGHDEDEEDETQQRLDLRKTPASREDIDFNAINADIDAGLSVDQIREKHNISDSLVYKIRKEKQEEEPITPLKPEQCKRVIEVISKLAEVHPDKFTRLDFLGQISKKYGSILAEII